MMREREIKCLFSPYFFSYYYWNKYTYTFSFFFFSSRLGHTIY